MMNPYTIGRKDIYSENFEFLSQGAKTFKMKVVYTYLGIEPVTQKHLYNLGFGVIWVDSETGLEDIDDKIITNNGDKDKVLFFQGSSPSRTRTYQMAIGQNIAMLKEDFVVRGYLENKDLPEIFQKSKNYAAFLIEQK
jgi:hypothetical protein